LIAWYANKELSPAYFTATDIDSEISRLSGQFGGARHVYRLNPHPPDDALNCGARTTIQLT
jgi:hypothetical protein